jgi:rhamnosyltransferase
MFKKSSKFISVFIPTFNGEKYIQELINGVLDQELPLGYKLEFIIIDSGSKDTTVNIIKENYLDKLNFLEITNSEFGHGKTRQRAAEMAKGEFILFLSQDASPHNRRWLINMLEPFFMSDKVGCVFGRQIPRPDAAATIKREVSSVFGGLGALDSLVVYRYESLIDNKNTGSLNTFFSDVNSAVRRNLLVTTVPFRDVQYAEDQALAEDMQKAGYLKAYAPLGAVWHSNEYTVREYYHRKFDEYIGLQESTGLTATPSLRSLLLGWIRPTILDYKFIRHDREYGAKSKLLWYLRSPSYNFALQLGKYHAFRHIHNSALRRKKSLEAGRRIND